MDVWFPRLTCVFPFFAQGFYTDVTPRVVRLCRGLLLARVAWERVNEILSATALSTTSLAANALSAAALSNAVPATVLSADAPAAAIAAAIVTTNGGR